MVKRPIDLLTKLKQSLLAKSNFDAATPSHHGKLPDAIDVCAGDAPDVAVHQLDINRAPPMFKFFQAAEFNEIAKHIAAGFLLVPAHRRRASERGDVA
ncbi:MAG: hypothetical protein WBV51_20335 [Pseudolabrys sp.]|jgi:hypothetical protein